MSSKKSDPLYPNPYSTASLSEPIAQHTAGRRYRVRDADGARVWGKDLTFNQAHKLKEQIAGTRKSKNPIIEDMSVPENSPPPAPAPQPHVSHSPQDAMRQAFEAGRAQGRAESRTPTVVQAVMPAPTSLPPPIVTTTTPSAQQPPADQNGAGAPIELDDLGGDLDLVDSAIDDSLQ